jgi:hypothetical protein
MKDYTRALGKTRETIKEMHVLETSLTGLSNAGMTVPHDAAVVSDPLLHIPNTKIRSGSLSRVDRPRTPLQADCLLESDDRSRPRLRQRLRSIDMCRLHLR